MITRDALKTLISVACHMEAMAKKPGNVHPEASFSGLEWAHMMESAWIVAPILAEAAERGVGQAILDAVAETRKKLGRNTNLGIVLLLAPLAAVPGNVPLWLGIGRVLDALTEHDAQRVYEAIRIAQPGGLGKVEVADVYEEPTGTLVDVMKLAADRDMVAAQFANGFDTVFNFGLKTLIDAGYPENGDQAVIGLHLQLMARYPDSLIQRKCGPETARESAKRAQAVLDAGWPGTPEGTDRFNQLDEWCREDGNKRNPGTTADLVAAILFAFLRDGP